MRCYYFLISASHGNILKTPPRISETRVSSKQSIFLRFELKQTETQSVWVVFWFVLRNQKNFFRFVSVCFCVSDGYQNNRNKQNFLKTNRNKPKKSPKKLSLLGVLENVNFFFSVRTETNRNSICFGCFSVCFFAKPKIIKIFFFGLFQFVSMFWTGIETNRTFGLGN